MGPRDRDAGGGDVTLQVWTARVSYGGADRLDVTRKSADEWGKSFAPSWALLRPALDARRVAEGLMAQGHAALESGGDEWGPTREAERVLEQAWSAYVPAYVDEMRRSYVTRRSDWERLLSMSRATLVCYCVDHEQCHRTLLARDILPRLGATYMGEVAPGAGTWAQGQHASSVSDHSDRPRAVGDRPRCSEDPSRAP